jgi:hypothetical protein
MLNHLLKMLKYFDRANPINQEIYLIALTANLLKFG